MQKAQHYCAYQDRCHQEMRYKLIEWGIYGDDLENILVALIEDKFLDEERFARSYAGGKFRIKKWGRQRIRRELMRRKISAYCLRMAMEEIPEANYRATLHDVLTKYLATRSESDPYQRKQKAIAYAVSRGYELELAYEVWPEVEP